MSKVYRLSDTSDIMLSDDWKERFVAEYIQLCIRLKRINDVVEDYYDNKLSNMSDAEAMTLLWQHHAMMSYYDAMVYRAKYSKIELPSSFEDYYYSHTTAKSAE